MSKSIKKKITDEPEVTEVVFDEIMPKVDNDGVKEFEIKSVQVEKLPVDGVKFGSRAYTTDTKKKYLFVNGEWLVRE